MGWDDLSTPLGCLCRLSRGTAMAFSSQAVMDFSGCLSEVDLQDGLLAASVDANERHSF